MTTNARPSFHNKQSCVLLFVLAVTLAAMHRSPADEPHEFGLRLVPIAQGNRASAFSDLPEKFHRTPVYKAARLCGVDITSPDHPLVVCSLKRRRAFYLFYNVVTNVSKGQDGAKDDSVEPYLIQRVRRTVTDTPRDGEPISKVDYLVEAMKTRDGMSKRPDQHFGSFGLYGFERREVIKEFEVGLGEVKGHTSGAAWPFDSGVLYHSIQEYQPEPASFDECHFTQSIRWTLRLTLDRHGNYSLKCPELGIEISRRVPSEFATLSVPPRPAVEGDESGAPAKVNPASRDVVLEEGIGVFDLRLNESRLGDVKKTLGEPIRVDRASPSVSNYSFGNGLKFNIYNDGSINTIMTTPEFGGRTSKGIQHGDPREKVNKVYGEPRRNGARLTQMHDGVLFWFSGEGKVTKIVLVRPSRRISPPATDKRSLE